MFTEQAGCVLVEFSLPHQNSRIQQILTHFSKLSHRCSLSMFALVDSSTFLERLDNLYFLSSPQMFSTICHAEPIWRSCQWILTAHAQRCVNFRHILTAAKKLKVDSSRKVTVQAKDRQDWT